MILMAMWLVDGNSMMSDYEVEMSNDEHDPASFHVKFLGPKESMLHTKQPTTNNQQPTTKSSRNRITGATLVVIDLWC
jgi:hypothetical protein